MTQTYSPGLHILLTLEVDNERLLKDLAKFESFTNGLLTQYDLALIGKVGHSFEGGGFTSNFCLKESHICAHTWPEFSQLTLDIYLCNYLRDNHEKVAVIAEAYVIYFEGKILNQTNVKR